MDSFCKHCGNKLDGDSVFCSNCGARIETAPTRPVYTQPVQTYQAAYAAPQPSKAPAKKKKRGGAIVALILAAVMLCSFLFTALVAPGFLLKKKPGGSVSPSHGKTASRETTAVPEDGLVRTDMGVTVDLALIDLEGETELTVKKLDTVTDDEMEATYTAYDISLGDLHDIGGYFEIRLPYSGRNIEAGQDPAECVAGMYYNEDIGDWESVIYRVDTDNKELVITTNHLSTYGCFEFVNEGKRLAKVSDVFVSSLYKPSREDVMAAINELKRNNGDPGEACRNLMSPQLEQSFDAWATAVYGKNEAATYVTNTMTLLTSGVPGVNAALGSSEIAFAMNEALGKCGQQAALLALITMYRKEGKTDNEIIGMYKDAVYYMGSLTGDATLGTIGASVWCVDYALTELGKTSDRIVEDAAKAAFMNYMNTENNYGMKKFKPRTLAEWRSILYKLAKKASRNNVDPEKVLMKEIDRYCGQFWELDSGAQSEAYLAVGLSADYNPKKTIKEAITNEYKHGLISFLTSALMKVQEDIDFDFELRQIAMLDKLKDILNRRTVVDIAEEVPDGGSPRYAGYTAVFAPLNPAAVESQWRGRLSGDGKASVPMTYIGWMLVGSPDRIELYAPGKTPGEDAPDKTVPFKLEFPKTTVVIGGEESGFVGTWRWLRSDSATEEICVINADGTGSWKVIDHGNGDRILANWTFTYEQDGNRLITGNTSGGEQVVLIYSKEDDTLTYTPGNRVFHRADG